LLVSPAKPLTRLLLWSLGFWRISVVRKPGAAPKGTARMLAAAPHYSLIDPFVMMYLELPCAVSKKAVGDLPFVGTLARAAQTIFVDRKDKDSKRATAQAIVERGQPGSEWPPVLIFPEGTCTNGTALVTFKPGPFLPGAPVQPVVLRYHSGAGYAAAARGESFSVSAATHEAELRMGLSMLQLANTLEVTYLPLYVPSPEEVADKALFAANVRAAMASELGVPTTAHSYEDVWLAGKAARYGIEQSFEVDSLTSLFNLSADGVTSLLERFHSLDSSGDGLLSLEEFSAALDLTSAAPGYAERLFSFFDADGSGAISYAEFVQGLALISPHTSSDEKVKLAFLLCDVDASGGVSVANLLSLLDYAKAHGLDLGSDGGGAASSSSPTAAISPTAVAAGPPKPKPPPLLQRSATSLNRAFAEHSASGGSVLSFEEFRAFLNANPDVLSLSARLMQDKLHSAELLKPMEEAVGRIKKERSERRGTS
jgi:lysophosphatidylcholine acyltransferase/lyso-PAF acetyltransferase